MCPPLNPDQIQSRLSIRRVKHSGGPPGNRTNVWKWGGGVTGAGPKALKSQEAASYSPAVSPSYLFFFFFSVLIHAAFVFSGRRDCHSRPCTRGCALLFRNRFNVKPYVTSAHARVSAGDWLWAVLLGKTLSSRQRNGLQTFANKTRDVNTDTKTYKHATYILMCPLYKHIALWN